MSRTCDAFTMLYDRTICIVDGGTGGRNAKIENGFSHSVVVSQDNAVVSSSLCCNIAAVGRMASTSNNGYSE